MAVVATAARLKKTAQWPAYGKVGSEYAPAFQQPQILIWIRHQSADADKRARLAASFRRQHAQLESAMLRRLSTVFSSLGAKIMDRFKQAGTVAVQVQEIFHPAELAIPFNHAMKPCWLINAEA